LLFRESSLRLSSPLKCLDQEPGRTNNLRSLTSKPRVSLELEAISIPFFWLESNLEKSSLRWASLKCQLTDIARVLSGTSMLFSSHRVIQRETCMIHSSLRIQQKLSACQRNTWKLLRKFTQQEDLALRVTAMTGKKMRQRKIF
jgi:hypothetical protein